MTGFLIGVLLTVHVITCIFLTLLILMQRPRSEGLGTAFGGGVTDTLFGSSAGNVLTKITTWLGILLFVTTLSLAFLYGRKGSPNSLGTRLGAIKTSAPGVATNSLEETNQVSKPSPIIVPLTTNTPDPAANTNATTNTK
jgi:preprotein translocase subunit SecG